MGLGWNFLNSKNITKKNRLQNGPRYAKVYLQKKRKN